MVRRRLPALWLGVAVALGSGLLAPSGAAAAADPAPWIARRPLNIAHAGGDLEAPHETMYAFEEAVAAGADMLELDLRLSADRELVVVHDDTVDRTSNGTGLVRTKTVAELQALDNAFWFVPACWSCHDRPIGDYALRGIRTGARAAPAGHTPDDFVIPTLAEVLDRFPHRLLDLEIKDGPDGLATAEALAELLLGTSRAERVVVVSFDDEIMDHFQNLAPDIATSPGLGATTDWFLGSRGPLPGKVALQVPPVYSGIEVVSQKFVDDAHAANLAVWVWFNGTDDDVPAEWNRLLDLGVDGLITGKPRALQGVLDARGGGFRTRLDIAPTLEVRRQRARLGVRCPALAADRCQALLGVLSGDAIVGGAVIELAPGEYRAVRIEPHGLRWRRLARRGLTAQVWAAGDTAPSISSLTCCRPLP